MTPQEGTKRLRKLLGPKACWQTNKRGATQEERDEASAKYAEVNAEYQRLKEARDARSKWLLENDAEYQRLATETKVARQVNEEVSGRRFSYRLRVGTNEGWAFMVKAEGDNWVEVIRKVEAMQKAKAS